MTEEQHETGLLAHRVDAANWLRECAADWEAEAANPHPRWQGTSTANVGVLPVLRRTAEMSRLCAKALIEARETDSIVILNTNHRHGIEAARECAALVTLIAELRTAQADALEGRCTTGAAIVGELADSLTAMLRRYADHPDTAAVGEPHLAWLIAWEAA